MEDNPKENVDDQLEDRLDDLSATLTDDDVKTESGASSQWGAAETDADTDDQDADTDDADQDADADDPS